MLSYAFSTIFMCFCSCAQSLSTLHTGIPSWMASFSLLHYFLLVSLMLVCSFVCPIHSALSFHTLVPCCSAALLLIFGIFALCCSASNLNLRRTTHLFLTIVVTEVVGRLFCLFGLLRVLFTRVLENFGCGFCILRSGIQGHAHPRCTCTCFAAAA